MLLILTALHFAVRRWRSKPLPTQPRQVPGMNASFRLRCPDGTIEPAIPNAYVRQVDHIEDENGNPIVFDVPPGMTVTYFEFTLPSIVDAYRHPDSPRAPLTLPPAPRDLRLN